MNILIGPKLAAALVKVQAEIKAARKDRTNPFFKNTYATLGSVWEAIHEALTKNHIAVVQAPRFRDGVQLLATQLIHESGEVVECEYIIRPVKDDPQGYGSALTYARRYCLAAMIGVLQDDDDGARGSTRGKGAADTGKIKEGLDEKLSAAERMALTKVAKKAGKTEQVVKAYLKEAYGVESTAELKKSDFQEIMAWCAEPKPNAAPPADAKQPELGDAA